MLTHTASPRTARSMLRSERPDSLAQLGGNARPAPPVPGAEAVLAGFAPIHLSEMGGVKLLNRTDTKFVLTERGLLSALRELQADYRVLEVDGVRMQHYRSLYYDTADFAHYRRHHAGAADRYKVRSRAYLDSHLAFFEVKHKVGGIRTIKKRMKTTGMRTQVGAEAAEFLLEHYPYEPAALLPALWNRFMRVTLVSTRKPERLTLDFDLAFARDGRSLALPGVAVAEVKQEGFSMDSDFIRQMRRLGVRRHAFSKYCLGMSYLVPGLKHNNFKRHQLMVEKLSRAH